MSDIWQLAVRQFMVEVKGLDLPRQPTVPGAMTRELCLQLIQEELDELAIHTSPELDEYPVELVAVADDLADLLYVVLYAANAYGIYMDPIFEEVQRSNMTKKGGAKRPDGKQLKGSAYEPPNLEPILKRQQYRPIAYVDDTETAWQQPETGRIIQDD